MGAKKGSESSEHKQGSAECKSKMLPKGLSKAYFISSKERHIAKDCQNWNVKAQQPRAGSVARKTR
jgi:hypothetical protein